MKTPQSILSALYARRATLRGKVAFTLVEVMITSAAFTLVMGSVLTLYIFSAKLTSGVSRQLEIDSQSRVLNLMSKEIKTSTQIDIQTYNGTTFTSVPVGTLQQGNAIAITCPSGSSTQQVLYWVNSSGELYRSTVGAAISKRWLTNVTNSNPFATTTYTGAVTSNETARMLIDITLQVLDTNIKNFRQSITLNTAAARRN